MHWFKSKRINNESNIKIDENSNNDSGDEISINIDGNWNDNTRNSESQNQPEIRRSQRTRNPLNRLNDYYTYNTRIFAYMCRTDVPNTFEEAIENNENKFG